MIPADPRVAPSWRPRNCQQGSERERPFPRQLSAVIEQFILLVIVDLATGVDDNWSIANGARVATTAIIQRRLRKATFRTLSDPHFGHRPAEVRHFLLAFRPLPVSDRRSFLSNAPRRFRFSSSGARQANSRAGHSRPISQWIHQC